MTVLQKLRQLVGELRRAKDPAKAREAWELALRLLARVPDPRVDLAAAERICHAQEIDSFDAMIAALEAPPAPKAVAAAQTSPASALAADASPAGAAAGTEMDRAALQAQMESALRAFRKRLKLARLADESTLGGRQLTSGKTSGIDAMIPPRDFPAAVWIALAEAGSLKHVGDGFYSLP